MRTFWTAKGFYSKLGESRSARLVMTSREKDSRTKTLWLHSIACETLLSAPVDADFYCRELGSASYCLVVVCGNQYEVASFVRRLLRHPGFDTHSKRMGKVVRVAPNGLRFWEVHQQAERAEGWKSRPA